MCRKSKLRVYREFKKDFECKKYLHGVSDMGSKLSFRFGSGTNGLNEELGRLSTRNSHYARYTHITFYAVTTYATYADQYANIST